MEQITENEFKALISLLDDPDEEVIHHVSNRLKDLGIRGVNKLEDAWEFAGDEVTQSRIEDLIKDIKVTNNSKQVNEILNKESLDLIYNYFKQDFELFNYKL